MSGLLTATDSAYPYGTRDQAGNVKSPPDFAGRPADCAVILGYVGRFGYTPHVWTLAEVEAARQTGCAWWPIVVGISQGPTSSADGQTNAQAMIDAAPGYGVAKTDPVFCDLEPTAYHADPAGAAAMAAAFKATMRAAGYTQPYVYGVDAPFIDWVADWTNVPPSELPAGKIGVQYGGAESPPGYDLSVFDPALLGGNVIGGLTDTQAQQLTDLHNWLGGGTAPGTVNEGTTIVATLQAVRTSVNDLNQLLADEKWDAGALAKLQTSLDTVSTALAALQGGLVGPVTVTGSLDLVPANPPAPVPAPVPPPAPAPVVS